MMSAYGIYAIRLGVVTECTSLTWLECTWTACAHALPRGRSRLGRGSDGLNRAGTRRESREAHGIPG